MLYIELNFRERFHHRTLLRIKLLTTDFYTKLCAQLSEPEMNVMKKEIEKYGIIMEKPVIEKIWNALPENGYISDFQDFLGHYIGMIILNDDTYRVTFSTA